jgi:predicted RNA-binding Zn-ribbon protein involved in translation (DUF1610 family)
MWRLRDFSNATVCPNCGKEAVQRIEMGPDETVITCMNCGAARHYTVDGIRLQETFDEDVPKG